jgi:predicted membrane channel-forming protein YqfA (hemolysin III family)
MWPEILARTSWNSTATVWQCVSSVPQCEYYCPILISNKLTGYSFHVFENHSPLVAKYCNMLDYLGIVVLMWGAAISTIHLGFQCDQALRVIYSTTVRSPSMLKLYRELMG